MKPAKKTILLLCIALALLALTVFMPRSILDPSREVTVWFAEYNPDFGRQDGTHDYVDITDKAGVAACLKGYKTVWTPFRQKAGFWRGNVEFQIIVQNGADYQVITLGTDNYIGAYGDCKLQILNADALRAELRALLADNGN